MTAPYRVIRWATGNTGQRALREVIRDPSFELVGVLVYSDEKHGVDAGELCGEPTTGVLATTDREAVLKRDADCDRFEFDAMDKISHLDVYLQQTP